MITTTINAQQGLPYKAIIIYKNQTRLTHASLHAIQEGIIQEGQALSTTALRQALERLSRKAQGSAKKELLPSNVLYQNDNEVLFFTQTIVRPHLYKSGGQQRPNPALLWQVRGRKLRLFALDSNERPNLDSKIYHAPYFNTTAHGVCTGDVVLPNQVSPNNQAAYVDGFFNSVFTHPSGHKNYNYPGSFSEMWEEASRLGHFPVEYLLEYGTLKQIL